jgi:hypothetical protein
MDNFLNTIFDPARLFLENRNDHGWLGSNPDILASQ